LQESPNYRLKDDLSCKLLKYSEIGGASQVASREWRGFPALGECHVSNVACIPSFISSPMRWGQLAQKAWKSSFHVTLTCLRCGVLFKLV